jgi:alpha-ketoglutarate-dependent taurine dioxygenase
VYRYFEEPPRYQLLHCLRNRVAGGSSIFVDGLHSAFTLSREHPAHFATLATTPIPFHYINDGHHLHHSHCTFELRPCLESEGQKEENTVFVGVKHHKIASINYAPPFQAPLPVTASNGVFEALENFSSILEDPQNRFEYLLKEGDVAIFDNRRVLHGRREFVELNEGKEGETNRWLKGCYLEEDAVLDKRRVLAGRVSR